jgi:hypothetical protein
MSSRTLLIRCALVATVLLISVPFVSGWTFGTWSVTPSGSDLTPGTPVSARFSLHFDSWNTGTTFDKDNTLMLYTDLASPQWVVTKSEKLDDDTPLTEQVPVTQGSQAKIDGWILSYSRKRFDLNVQLTGKTPAPNQSATITLMKLQEREPGAKPIASSLVQKQVRVIVPTPEPTPAPQPVTLNMTPAEIIEITPEPTSAVLTPTKKVTYSPGPEPVLVVGILAGLVVAAWSVRRKK